MKVNVTYDAYNTGIELAQIDASNDNKFVFSTIPVDEVNLEKKLEIKAINDLNPTGIPLQMTFAEAKQFNLLLNQFVIQLQPKTV